MFKSLKNQCVTLKNVTTKHHFTAVKSYSITFSFYIFELGSKESNIFINVTSTTKTCHHCICSDKREHIILIFEGNKQYFSTVMHFCSILICFSSVLVCELKFCNVMWSLTKALLSLPKMCSHYRNMGCFVK